jgi:GR25 family glycosyltransferase involved in LPS biosynthesis
MIFNTLFDNIYVLNLKESNDRKIHIENEFKRVGIEKYQFFEATNYDSEEVKTLTNSNFVKKFPNCFRCNKKRCNCENNFLTPYQLGNWCSFLNIFKDIIKNDYKFVLICEDDIVFSFQHERIINKLLSPQNFRNYRINMNKPLLIRMGTAYNPQNHNSNANPVFLKNFSLCNPCFAINKELAIVYLHFLKIIDYHSDIYFHRKIPHNIPGVQYFTMYPYPVYELSFVKEKQKFESLVRPKNGYRRIEYKEFLFLTSNSLLNIFVKSIIKNTNLSIGFDHIGFNGNVNSFIFLDEKDKGRYYFENKILLIDDYYSDIKIIYESIINNNIISKKTYNLYIIKIKELYNIDIDFNNNLLKNVITFYDYLLKLLKLENILIININDSNDLLRFSKYFNMSILNNNINIYNNYKTLQFKNINLSDNDIDSIKNIIN